MTRFDALYNSLIEEEQNQGVYGSAVNAQSSPVTTTPGTSAVNTNPAAPAAIPSVELTHPDDVANIQQILAGKVSTDPNWTMDATNRGLIKDGLLTPAGQLAFQKKQNPALGMNH